MSKEVKVPRPEPPSGQGWNSKALRRSVSSVVGAIGLIYLQTDSLAVTIVGAVAALVAAALFLVFGRDG